MEIRKPEKHTPKYPAAEVVKKVGAAVAAAGLLAGMMTGCRQIVQIDGDVPYVPDENLIMGDIEYSGVDDEDWQDAVSCTDAQCSDSDTAGTSAE